MTSPSSTRFQDLGTMNTDFYLIIYHPVITQHNITISQAEIDSSPKQNILSNRTDLIEEKDNPISQRIPS